MSTDLIRHNPESGRFEAGGESNPAHLDYRMSNGVVQIFHTEVPAEYQGQGLAGKLATAALVWARGAGFQVHPTCSYVTGFIAKRPEYSDLLA